MNLLPAPAAVARPSSAPKNGSKENLQAELDKAKKKAGALAAKMDLRGKKAKEIGHALLITGEIQAAVFGSSFLSGFMRARGKSLKIWKVDLRWVVGGALVLSGVLLQNAAAEHLLALGNGVIASAVSELAFDLGQKFGTKSAGSAAPAAAPAPAPAATAPSTLGVDGVPSVRLLDDGSGLQRLGTLGADGAIVGDVGAALDPIERFNGEIAIAKNLYARARKANESGNGEVAAELRGEAHKHVEFARNIHQKYKVGKMPEQWAHGGGKKHHATSVRTLPGGRSAAAPRQAIQARPRVQQRPTQQIVEDDQEIVWDDQMGQEVQPGNSSAAGNEFVSSLLDLPDAEFDAMVSGVEETEADD